MKANMTLKNDENGSLDIQIKELRKENSVIQQLIIMSTKKIVKLENVIGSYKNTKSNK